MAVQRKRVGVAFGAALRAARRDRGLTQEDLAEMASCVPHYISGVENGHQQPSVGLVVAFEVALGLAPGELIRRTREALGRGRSKKP